MVKAEQRLRELLLNLTLSYASEDTSNHIVSKVILFRVAYDHGLRNPEHEQLNLFKTIE